jgi:hypothetical protein
MLVANSIHSPHPLLRERRLPRPGRGGLCVKTHPQPCPAASQLLAPKSNRIRSSAKHTHNPFRMRSFKTQDLKSFRIRICKKRAVGEVLLSTRIPSTDFCSKQPSGVRGLSFHPSTKGPCPVGKASTLSGEHCLFGAVVSASHYSLRLHGAIALKKGWQRRVAY